MRLVVLPLAVLTAGVPGNVRGPDRDDRLVGTWKLVSVSSATSRGVRSDAPFGPRPTGILITLRNPSTSLNGRVQTFDLGWERLK